MNKGRVSVFFFFSNSDNEKAFIMDPVVCELLKSNITLN